MRRGQHSGGSSLSSSGGAGPSKLQRMAANHAPSLSMCGSSVAARAPLAPPLRLFQSSSPLSAAQSPTPPEAAAAEDPPTGPCLSLGAEGGGAPACLGEATEGAEEVNQGPRALPPGGRSPKRPKRGSEGEEPATGDADVTDEQRGPGTGVFSGVVAVFDPVLGAEAAQELRRDLAGAGGREAPGAFMGSGATHVVRRCFLQAEPSRPVPSLPFLSCCPSSASFPPSLLPLRKEEQDTRGLSAHPFPQPRPLSSCSPSSFLPSLLPLRTPRSSRTPTS